MDKNEVQKVNLWLARRNPHFSTSHHQPAPPAESWELPFVFSIGAPLGLSIKKEFARFRHTSWEWRGFCFCEMLACCLLLVVVASWPEIYMEDGAVIYVYIHTYIYYYTILHINLWSASKQQQASNKQALHRSTNLAIPSWCVEIQQTLFWWRALVDRKSVV